MNQQDLEAQVFGNIDGQEKVIESTGFARARRIEAESNVRKSELAIARAKDRLQFVAQAELTIYYQSDAYVQEGIDPRTGTQTQEWAAFLGEQHLEKTENFVAAKKAFNDAQEIHLAFIKDLNDADAGLATVSDKLGSLKNRGLQLAALVELASAKGRAKE